jgi:MEMO1 family protein
MNKKIFSPDDQKSTPTNRRPCVAGKFYPGDKNRLAAVLKTMFGDAKPHNEANLLAVVSPHAGYVYSGRVAAAAFGQIDPNRQFERIFLIGSSHRTYFDGASVYNQGNYLTPLGESIVDTELANKFINENDCFRYSSEADLNEHSLEVQLPFLQYRLKTNYKIVPIIIATQSKDTIIKIANVLKPFFNQKNLFVISTDFSHYPSYEDACRVDKLTADAIASNSSFNFMKCLEDNEARKIPHLATSICGWSSVLALLHITGEMSGIEIKQLEYQNSGDAAFGDKEQVVGYWAMAVYGKNVSALLTSNDKEKLLNIAKKAIVAHISQTGVYEQDYENCSESLRLPFGAFVSVYVAGQLRGCIGWFETEEPLCKAVAELALLAATEDSRFQPVSADELPNLGIEISVLTPLKAIENINEIEVGKHGIYLRLGIMSGTFLPQVALNNNWSREEFLGYCARDKAKIGWEGWKKADVFTYEADVFGYNVPLKSCD